MASQGKRLAACCTDVPLIQALWRTNTPPPSPTELLNMFEGLRCFSSVKGSFSFTHIRGGIGGEGENESVWGCGVRWYSCSSEVCLVGPELYWLERKLTAEF